jgi:hypothetical protein
LKTIALTAAFPVASTLGVWRGVQVAEEPFAPMFRRPYACFLPAAHNFARLPQCRHRDA